MAYAEQGAVIVEVNSDRVVYKNKCEVCGNIEYSTRSHTLSKGGTLSTGFSCKCGHNQKVRVTG